MRSRRRSSTNPPALPDPVFFIDADLSDMWFLHIRLCWRQEGTKGKRLFHRAPKWLDVENA
jgi:hypothetical protein